ncbi:MAG: DUF4168 domain-containing protein [Cyanothece sp. SIO1E1]|nr:DUF4168 domain-containing protein [Cyanothece sp. SIO1E1]
MKLFRPFLLISTLSLVSLITGLAPYWQARSLALGISAAAHAQTLTAVSNEEVHNYALSVLGIEPIRQVAYRDIKQITLEVPEIACHMQRGLLGLPDNIRGIALSYCDRSIAVVESNNLTIRRFNDITDAQQRDPSLASRIQEALLEILRSSRGPE